MYGGNGRFLQQDNVLGSLNQPRTLHRYTYGFNNPVNYTDPSGHMPPDGSNGSGSGGGNSGGGSGGSSASGPGSSSPDKSANSANWSTYSDAAARGKSQGHRSLLCGLVGVINNVMALTNQLTPQQVQTLIGIGIIAGSIIATGGASIPFIMMGATIGGSIAYGIQGMHNRQEGTSFWEAVDPRNIDWSQVMDGAFQGAVSGAVAGVVSYYLPVATTGVAGVAMLAGVEFISGRAEQVAVNVVSKGWSHWNDDLFEPDKLSWWGQVALDVLPGVGATMFKPALKGIKSSVGAGFDKWRITKRLDDYVTRGTPVNSLNRLKAHGAAIKAIPNRVANRLNQVSIPRKLAVGQAGLKKHLSAWFNRNIPNLDTLPHMDVKRGPEPFNTTGLEKDLFDVLNAEGYVWLQPKWWGGPNLMEGELAGLKILEEYGLPTPRNFGKVEYRGRFGVEKVAVIQERMVGGSRDFMEMFEAEDFLGLKESPLNEVTIRDLQKIRETISENDLVIPDLQFLIAKDGRVVINDPQMPRKAGSVEEIEASLTELNKLLDIAEHAIQLRSQSN